MFVSREDDQMSSFQELNILYEITFFLIFIVRLTFVLSGIFKS